MNEKPKPRFRFTLRALLVAMLVLAVPLAWWVNSAMRQRRAVKTFAKLGASVAYAPSGPRGNARDFFCPVRDLYGLPRTNVADDDLVHLKGVRHIHSLDLSETQITDAGLRHLNVLTNLRNLWLSNTQVSDAGLKHLKRMKNLTHLEIYHTDVSKKGAADLQNALPKCTILFQP